MILLSEVDACNGQIPVSDDDGNLFTITRDLQVLRVDGNSWQRQTALVEMVLCCAVAAGWDCTYMPHRSSTSPLLHHMRTINCTKALNKVLRQTISLALQREVANLDAKSKGENPPDHQQIVICRDGGGRSDFALLDPATKKLIRHLAKRCSNVNIMLIYTSTLGLAAIGSRANTVRDVNRDSEASYASAMGSPVAFQCGNSEYVEGSVTLWPPEYIEMIASVGFDPQAADSLWGLAS